MQFKAGKPINSGVRLSGDRQQAWRLQGFNPASGKTLLEAADLIRRVHEGPGARGAASGHRGQPRAMWHDVHEAWRQVTKSTTAEEQMLKHWQDTCRASREA